MKIIVAIKIKNKTASPVRSQKGIERKYRKELSKLGRAMAKAVRESVLEYIKTNENVYVADNVISHVASAGLSVISDKFNIDNEYELWDDYIEFRESILTDSRKKVVRKYFVKDGFADDLEVIFNRLNAQFTGTLTTAFAENTAATAVGATVISNKKKFDRTVRAATGVDLTSIITTEGIDDFVKLSINKNVSLIKSLPEEYLTQVETIVNNGVVSGARYSTIEKEIIAKTNSANSKLANRIATIARNEIQTINSQISLRRSEALGINKGIYRTSEDERVRTCHDELNGKEYEIAKGAWSPSCQKYIQPGITDINCRCSFSPIIEVQ